MKMAIDGPNQVFVASIIDVPGVAGAANNFLSVFNPAGSGKVFVFPQVQIQAYATGANSTAQSMKLYRISAASGGVTITPNVFNPAAGPSAGETRVSNPTVTVVGDAFGGTAPAVSAGLGAAANVATSAAQGNGVVCFPGSGLVFRTDDGDVDQRWNASMFWAEL